MTSRFVSFVSAEGVAIDQLSGRVTAFNMIDQIFVVALPSLFLRLNTVSMYELGDEPHSFSERVRFVGPQGEQLSVSEVAISLMVRVPHQLPNSHRSIHALWRVKLENAGDHRLVLERRSTTDADWEKLAEICVTVLVQQNTILNSQSPPVTVPPPTRAADVAP